MRVLISAYACEPGKGSEPEVGWRWVLEMSQHYHITVITRSNNQSVIASYLKDKPEVCRNVDFRYFDLPLLALKAKKISNVFNWYYILWQYQARKKIDHLIDKNGLDLVHHVTFASFRYPVFLGELKVPVVWGPVGGGEIAPWPLLWYRLRFTSCFKEAIRNFSTSLSVLFVQMIAPSSDLGIRVIASTPNTLEILEKKGIEAILLPTIGMDVDSNKSLRKPIKMTEGLKFIFVGRLVFLKGVHLLLEAFAKADIESASLSIVGDGTERKYLEVLADELGIGKRVRFLGQVPKEKLADLYCSHHVVVAPSLYESGGYMVLEGFEQGCPAIVMNVGGLALSVDENCGIKISPGSGKDVVQDFSIAMSFYANQPDMIEKHGHFGFLKLCRVYNWKKKSMEMRGLYEELVKREKY